MPKTRKKVSTKVWRALSLAFGTLFVSLLVFYVSSSSFTLAGNNEDDDERKEEKNEKDEKKEDDSRKGDDHEETGPTDEPLASQSPPREPHIIIIPESSESSPEDDREKTEKDEKKDDSKTSSSKNIEPVVSEPLGELSAFFLNPMPSTVENPLITFSGSKPLDSTIFINNKEIDSTLSAPFWTYNYFLSPGKNKLKFEAKNQSDRILGKAESEIIYRQESEVGVPIVNIIKPHLSADTRLEIEKTTERKDDGEVLTHELEKISDSAQSAIQETLRQYDFYYISKSINSPMASFLSYEDREEILIQNFGGPRIKSPSHPNQSLWSNQSDAVLEWEDVENAQSYQIGIASTPAEPSNVVAANVLSWNFLDLPDGIWYFAVRARVPGGITLTNFYRLLVDSTSPKVVDLMVTDPYPVYKNGSLVNLRIKFSDNLFNPADVESLPHGVPSGFLSADDLANVISRRGILPDFGRLIEADFSPIDSEFARDRVMIDGFRSLTDGTIEANISYLISTENKKRDTKDISLLVSVQDYVGSKTYATAQVSLENKKTPVKVTNHSEFEAPMTVASVSTQGITFKGKAFANATIILQIYSENPISVTVISDEEGNWTYTLKEELPLGNHTVYAYVKNEEESLPLISQVAAFSLINEAQAKEISELSKPVFSLKPVGITLPSLPKPSSSLPPALKLALLLYALSFTSLVAALLIWYRENPPHNA